MLAANSQITAESPKMTKDEMPLICHSITFTTMYENRRDCDSSGSERDVGYVTFGVLCALD